MRALEVALRFSALALATLLAAIASLNLVEPGALYSEPPYPSHIEVLPWCVALLGYCAAIGIVALGVARNIPPPLAWAGLALGPLALVAGLLWGYPEPPGVFLLAFLTVVYLLPGLLAAALLFERRAA